VCNRHRVWTLGWGAAGCAGILTILASGACAKGASGGSGGSNTGGSGGSGATGGAATGGSSSGGSPGTGGTSATGGTTNTGGTTSSGGSGGALPPPPAEVQCTPEFAVLNDFSEYVGKFGSWLPGKITGGPLVFPVSALIQDFSEGTWHVTGTVSQDSGMNFYFNGYGPTEGTYCNLLDASAYTGGVMVDASGDPGPSGTLALIIEYFDGTGATASAQQPIPVTSAVETVKAPWTSFTGGTIDTSKISNITFSFTWSADLTSYPVDVVLDNVGFY
jgi:hypothetical protein